MSKKYNSERINLFQGDSLEVLKEFPDNSIDSIVTDPPYGLGKEPDPVEVMRDWVEQGYHEVKSKGGFMGKKWDSFVPQPIIWKECLRVLKPGGHLLAFSGTRTHDWMTMSLRFAGFEIRDMIAWVYGSGFPKSHDISKAIDKAAGAEHLREFVCKNPADRPYTHTRGETSTGWQSPVRPDKTAPATEAAQQWQGWGTALKPALEPITLARKPLSEKTVAKNVLEYGTGGINVDGCRVGTVDNLNGGAYSNNREISTNKVYGEYQRIKEEYSQPQGRWPANLIHDGSEEVLRVFPDAPSAGRYKQPDELKDVGARGADWSQHIFKAEANKKRDNSYAGDSGSAARFFYCAKASKRDRDEGCESLNEKQYSHDGREVPIENAYQRNNSKARNHHPTVKPTDLLRYLCRLITPPNGIVLDPFMGSGSTGKACVKEGFRFIGIDLEEEYFEIAKTRILHEASKPQVQDLFTEVAKKKVKRGQV